MGSRLGSSMTFFERVHNTFLYHINTYVRASIILPYVDKLRAEYGLTRTHAEAQANTGILIAQTSWATEFPHVIVPAVKVVGPILPSPGKPLSPV